jgi:chromate transport protein ChrA
VPIAAGVLIALSVHGVKAASRPVVNASTAGFGAPVASTVEDFGSVVMSLLAILLPVLVLIALVVLVLLAGWVLRRRQRRRREKDTPVTQQLFG